jgi:hypothetical protein
VSISFGSADTARLSAAVSELSESIPFGSHAFLAQELSTVHVQFLALLAERSAGAEALLGALGDTTRDAVLSDPLVRRTIEDGVCAVVRGLDAIDQSTLDEVLHCAAAAAEAGEWAVLPTVARCVPLDPGAGRAHVWAENEPSTLPGRRFVEEVSRRVPGFRIDAPTDDQAQVLAEGQRLAMQVAPGLARSAMSHLRVVVVGDVTGGGPSLNALTVPGMPGVVLLSPWALTDRAAVAESLVHESMHLKFLDIEYARPLFPVGFRPFDSPRITPAWHENDPKFGGWPLDRLLTSMHVYLSLAVLHSVAADGRTEGWFDPDDCAARAERSRARATWLFKAAQDHLEQLAPAGREFVHWIGSMLEVDLSRQ